MVKGFKFSMDYVLYDLSYSNLILLGATLPSYNYDKEKRKRSSEGQYVINAEDPKNKDAVKQFFNSID